MSGDPVLVPVAHPATILDPAQFTRIEAVHRGFLFHHLYTVQCLLKAAELSVQKALSGCFAYPRWLSRFCPYAVRSHLYAETRSIWGNTRQSGRRPTGNAVPSRAI